MQIVTKEEMWHKKAFKLKKEITREEEVYSLYSKKSFNTERRQNNYEYLHTLTDPRSTWRKTGRMKGRNGSPGAFNTLPLTMNRTARQKVTYETSKVTAANRLGLRVQLSAGDVCLCESGFNLHTHLTDL
jgi:hypothetical protein